MMRKDLFKGNTRKSTDVFINSHKILIFWVSVLLIVTFWLLFYFGKNDTNQPYIKSFSNPVNIQPVIVTAANSRYFAALQNLIGSIKIWEPNIKIIVYNLGLLEDNVEEMKNWCNVEHKLFDFKRYPEFVSELGKFAWKPLIIAEESSKHPLIFWLDSGVELRKPLKNLTEIVKRDGYWMHGWDKLCRLIHPGMMTFYNTKNTTELCSHKMNEANIIGILQGSSFDNLVIKKATQCALDEKCIAPDGSDLTNHRYDQSLFSLLAALNNFPIQNGVDIRCCSSDKVPKNITLETDIYFMLRRNIFPKPYIKYAKQKCT